MKNSNDMTEEEQIDAFNVYGAGYVISRINSPSEKVQLAAVKRNAASILCIENPSKDILLISIISLLIKGSIHVIEPILVKYSYRNYPEFDVIRRSIENDK